MRYRNTEPLEGIRSEAHRQRPVVEHGPAPEQVVAPEADLACLDRVRLGRAGTARVP
jgi:hypothetical protein